MQIKVLHKHDCADLSHQALKEPAGLEKSSSRIASIVSVVEVPQNTEGTDVKDGADGSHYKPTEWRRHLKRLP